MSYKSKNKTVTEISLNVLIKIDNRLIYLLGIKTYYRI